MTVSTYETAREQFERAYRDVFDANVGVGDARRLLRGIMEGQPRTTFHRELEDQAAINGRAEAYRLIIARHEQGVSNEN